MEAVVALEHDAQLMLRVRDGDLASYTLLLERHRGPVISYLYRMTQNLSVAEELAQEVFLRVYRSRQTYQANAKFTTWLFRIATHLALNWIRDRKKDKGQASLDQASGDGMERQVEDDRPTVEEILVNQVRLYEVRTAIDSLPAKQRAAVLMHKYEELDYSKIANALDCSESAVKSLLFRAYESLRARLAHLAH
jgi:RNA polymerase sigma-70 factor (ECF subfamily)